MRPNQIETDIVRQTMAALAHGDAYQNPKRAAAAMGVTTRTARRWRSPYEAKGSPQCKYAKYLRHSSDPFRLVASNYAEAVQSTTRKWSKSKLITEYREALKRDKHHEAQDTANALSRGVRWLDRAADSERDVADDLLKAACEREFAVRGISEEEVFDS